MPPTCMKELVALCKSRGFVFQSAEIYGGLQGVFDYGPLGVELKNNLRQAWWKANVYNRDDIEGLDSSILGHSLIYDYSGHTDTFTDLMVDCYDCKSRWRYDTLTENKCERCGSSKITEPRPFNMMFDTKFGPVSESSSKVYLRPETAQGIFVNFKNIIDTTHKHLPFGVAQIGKAFRNEITPRNFLFRVREFEQMEIEYFVHPETAKHWFQYWVEERYNWWIKQGLSIDNLNLFQQQKEDLAHYSTMTTDILYKYPHGYEELEGIANRTNFDLGSHTKSQSELNLVSFHKRNVDSLSRLAVFDIKRKEWFVPHVIEPSAGLDRGFLAILNDAYTEEILENGKKRIVLKLKPHLAPIKAAIVPLARNNQVIMEKSIEIQRMLQKLSLGRIILENSGNIGKSYRRHDETGTPICLTVDFETIANDESIHKNTVTLRDRDSMKQHRINISDIVSYFSNYFNNNN